MLDLAQVDLDDLVMALSDQNEGYHSWLINPATRQLHMWSDDIGLDGNDSLDEDEIEQRGLLPAGPIRSHEWYRLMVDFAAQVTDAQARDLLEVALDGRGAFRRFRDVLHRRHPELLSAWRQFEEVGGRRMAVDWLAEEELISRDAAAAYALEHPLPEVP